jgi:hypothetical protein
MKNGSPKARAIVANLAWRYRLARRLVRKAPDGAALIQRRAQETEAWNALESSRRILYGLEF